MNRGSCLCGAVQFEAGPAGFMVHCHCSMCRKHHGAVFATFLAVPREGFRWLAGADEIVTYRSSERGLRPFCRNCGSALPVVLPDWSSIVFVPAGNIEGDPGVRPELHMFTASRADWYPISDGLPQHASFPPVVGAGQTVERPAPALKAGVVGGNCLCDAIAW